MTSDNKVCSFLLLILIGLAIYYILNNESFTSLNKSDDNLHENFVNYDNSMTQNNEYSNQNNQNNEYSNQNNQNNQNNEYSNQYNQNNDYSNQYNQNNEYSNQYNQNNEYSNQYNQNNEYSNQYNQNNEYSNQYDETSNQNIEYDVSNEPYVPQSVINDIVVNQNTQHDNVLESPNIYNFQPNDESEFDVLGSNLTDAFELPLPHNINSNAVDFKKQNVDNYNAKDFLPREINDEWFETDFSLAKYQLNDDKLINTEKYIIGINTVGQSLKNASWDIRGTLPNPKLVVSPWNNSTYEPDFNLKPLC